MAPSGRPTTLRICGHTFIPRLLSAESAVVDLGVNRGEFARAVYDLFGCHVYGAEPTPELFTRLESRDRLSVLPVAIGGTTRKATLNIYPDTCSSMLSHPGGERQKQVDVDVMTLSAFLDHFCVGNVDLLKIDIEGAEVEVFASTPDHVWRRCKQITVEFHDFIFPALRSAVGQIGQRMVRLGFYRINMSRDNTDVLFVNRELTDVGYLEYLYVKFAVKYAAGLNRMLRRKFRRSRPA